MVSCFIRCKKISSHLCWWLRSNIVYHQKSMYLFIYWIIIVFSSFHQRIALTIALVTNFVRVTRESKARIKNITKRNLMKGILIENWLQTRAEHVYKVDPATASSNMRGRTKKNNFFIREIQHHKTMCLDKLCASRWAGKGAMFDIGEVYVRLSG